MYCVCTSVMAHDVKDCVTPAKTLSYLVNSRHVTADGSRDLVNSRHAALITDAELSLVKVSQLERIHFHQHHRRQQQQHRHRTSSVSVQHRSRGLTAAVCRPTLSALYLVIVAVCLVISQHIHASDLPIVF